MTTQKDLLKFTNSLSRIIGSSGRNILSALTTDIAPPDFPEPEQYRFDPACACELKGRDQGIFTVCQRNCCCLIFRQSCACNLPDSSPCNPINIDRAAQTGSCTNADTGMIKAGSNGCIAFEQHKSLRKIASPGQIKKRVQQCSPVPPRRMGCIGKVSPPGSRGIHTNPSHLPQTCTSEAPVNPSKLLLVDSNSKAELGLIPKPLPAANGNKQDTTDKKFSPTTAGTALEKTRSAISQSVAPVSKPIEVGEVRTTEIQTSKSWKLVLHKIRLCLGNYTELVANPHVANAMTKLQKIFKLRGNVSDFTVFLSRNEPDLVIVCREGQSCASYARFLVYAAKLGIVHYFTLRTPPVQLEWKNRFSLVRGPNMGA